MGVRLVKFSGTGGNGDSWINPIQVVAVTSEGPRLSTVTLNGGGKLRVPEDAEEVARKLAEA